MWSLLSSTRTLKGSFCEKRQAISSSAFQDEDHLLNAFLSAGFLFEYASNEPLLSVLKLSLIK